MVVVAFAAVILAAAYVLVFSSPAGNSPPVAATPAPSPTPKAIASNNDTVEVDYTVRVENGSVFDTSLEQVAREAGIYKSAIRYQPLRFTLGSGDMIAGFEEAVAGMRVGEEKNVIVPPEKAYGEHQATLLSAMPRIYAQPRVEEVPLADFRQAFPNFNFEESQTVEIESWNATVLAVTNQSVILRHDPAVNQTIQTGAWPETVINVTDTQVVLRRDPQLAAVYAVTDFVGNARLATVRSVSDDNFMLDYNPPLAGHTLNFTIKLLRIL